MNLKVLSISYSVKNAVLRQLLPVKSLCVPVCVCERILIEGNNII